MRLLRDDYYEKTRALLERAYLEADDPRGGSGFGGDETRWERARRPIVSAIDCDGTFLHVGCANGLLMESLATWAGEEPVEETLRSWGYTVAGEAEGVDTNGAVFTRIAWTNTPDV